MDYIKFETTKNEIDMYFEDLCKSADDAIMKSIFGKVKKPDIQQNNLDMFSDDLRNAYLISNNMFNREVPREPDCDGDEISYEDEMYHYEKDAEEYAFDVKDTADQLYVVLNDLVYGDRMLYRYKSESVLWLTEKINLLKTFYDNLSKFRNDVDVDRVYGLLRNDFNWDGIDDTITTYVDAIVDSTRELKLQVEYVERYATEILEDQGMVKSMESSFMEMRPETVFSRYTMELEDVMNLGNKLNDRLLAYVYVVNRDTGLCVWDLMKS